MARVFHDVQGLKSKVHQRQRKRSCSDGSFSAQVGITFVLQIPGLAACELVLWRQRWPHAWTAVSCWQEAFERARKPKSQKNRKLAVEYEDDDWMGREVDGVEFPRPSIGVHG
jgi:hypothetical protein